MPSPTNPPCIGSCPLPPPETNPTLPFLGASLRMITLGSYSTRIRSPCAAAIPAMASLTSVSGVLINFLSLVFTAASAIAASSSLSAVGKTRRKMNVPIAFPINSPIAMAARLNASNPASKRGASTARITAPIASPPPPIRRMRFSRSSRERGRARRAGEGFAPRSPWALPICRFSWRDTFLSRACPRRFGRRQFRCVRTDRDGQVLVYHEVVDVSSKHSTDERHHGRDPDVEGRPGDRVRAVADQQHPDPGPEVTGRVQGCHLDRREEPDECRHHDANRQRRHIGGRRHAILDDPEDRNPQDCRDQDLGARPNPPRIDL